MYIIYQVSINILPHPYLAFKISSILIQTIHVLKTRIIFTVHIQCALKTYIMCTVHICALKYLRYMHGDITCTVHIYHMHGPNIACTNHVSRKWSERPSSWWQRTMYFFFFYFLISLKQLTGRWHSYPEI